MLEIIGILGGGAMGRGIAQVALQNNKSVIVYDVMPNAAEIITKHLTVTFDLLIGKAKITNDQKNEYLANLKIVDSMQKLADCDLIIEAIIEDLQLKKTVFNDLSKVLKSAAIVCSNTSSFSLTAIASAYKDPSRCLGLHFFNPAPVMPLVEIIPAYQTDPLLVEQLKAEMTNWKKTPVVAKDTPGFIVNRIARPFYSEALRIYEENLATKEDIDLAMRQIGGFKMGPFELMDFIGHDVNFSVTNSVWQATFYDPKYKPSLSQQKLVEAGFLGRKTNRGFYTYGADSRVQNLESTPMEKLKPIFDRIITVLINEAYDALYWQLADAEDIELAMTKGVNYPKGLLAWGKEIGLENIKSRMDALHNAYKEERYRCSQYLSRYSG
ncbi:MAG: 3-hydroxybutyryl-CoA dehydrogenase [Saprospiraceae bacterium]|nr:3-hydroxybutyryl-CoA dehydrogenase [Saprospiraceae bacterium]